MSQRNGRGPAFPISADEARRRRDARARIVEMDDGRLHVYRGAWSVRRIGESWLVESPDGDAVRTCRTPDAACDYIDRILDRRTP